MAMLVSDEALEHDPSITAQLVKGSQFAALKYCVETLEGSPLIVGPHHQVLCNTLDRVINGEIKRLIINIPPGYGKCSHEDSLVLTRRGYIKASDVVVGDEFCSFDSGRAVWSKCEAMELHKKPCIRVKTRTGREYVASYDHPIRTQRGWTKLQEINPQEHYAVTFNKALEFGEPIPSAELDLITLLLFEGSCSQQRSTGFTSGDVEVVDVMRRACDELGLNLYQRASGIDYYVTGCEYVKTAGSRSTNGKPHSIAIKLRNKYKINGLAKNKTFPEQFDNLPLAQRWRFIGLMFATDGWMTSRCNQLGVTLASKNLIQGCQRLLASCGVPSVVTYKKNKHAGAWNLNISAAYASYIEENTNALHKQNRFAEYRSKKRQSYIDAYPSEVFKGGNRGADIKAGLRTDSLKKHITQDRWERIVEAYPENESETLHDFHYDVITEKENAGVHNVIHFQVKDTANYVSDGIVTHNTLAAVWTFIARGFVVNPCSRFIHTSYGSELALDNSAKVKEILESELFQYINPITMRDDTKAKGLWRTDNGGGMRAAASGSGITGFRAGQMDESGFTGAFVIDDPVKPDDINSRTKTSRQNERYSSTIQSRLAHEGVPIVVIMQRLVTYAGEFYNDELKDCGDLCEFLLRGGSGETWDHLELPVEIDNDLPYPEKYTHGKPIDHGLPDGVLWEKKHTEVDVARLKRASVYVYDSQYGQRPRTRKGDTILKREWFQRYDPKDLPDFKRIELFADTANKKGDANDYSVLTAAGETHDGECYILEVFRKKMTIPELHKEAVRFWNKWTAKGATAFNIEDAQSGTFLIQSMSEQLKHAIVGIIREKDKFTRVNGVVLPISSGYVYLPTVASWVDDFLNECEDFTDDDSHNYDDQIDTLADAIEKLVHMKEATTSVSFTPAFM